MPHTLHNKVVRCPSAWASTHWSYLIKASTPSSESLEIAIKSMNIIIIIVIVVIIIIETTSSCSNHVFTHSDVYPPCSFWHLTKMWRTSFLLSYPWLPNQFSHLGRSFSRPTSLSRRTRFTTFGSWSTPNGWLKNKKNNCGCAPIILIHSQIQQQYITIPCPCHWDPSIQPGNSLEVAACIGQVAVRATYVDTTFVQCWSP